jgi:hypothetical protein
LNWRFDLFSLKSVELYLDRLNKVSEKKDKNWQRIFPFIVGAYAALFFGSNGAKILVLALTSIALLMVSLFEDWFDKSFGISRKTELCLHIIREAQLMKTERDGRENIQN